MSVPSARSTVYDGRQIIRAGLEEHFCAKLLRLPMGCDVCYTDYAEADQNNLAVLLTLLGGAGCTFIMGIPGSGDITLNHQTTSFYDALYARRVLGLWPAPEFETWQQRRQFTAARMALGRTGVSMRCGHLPLDVPALER